MIEVFNYEQRSPEWFKCRLGIPTASRFSHVLSKGSGKTRDRYMRQLASEIIEGEPFEPLKTEHLDRGKEMEAEALQAYSETISRNIYQVGFIKRGRAGCSPDGLVGEIGGVELKTALPKIQAERVKKDRLPLEYVAQVQGNLWISDREWWDFVSYWPDLPLFKKRVYRDEQYIRRLSDEIDVFNLGVDQMVEDLRDLPRW